MVQSLEMAQTLLRPEQVDDLVAQYRKGATPVELASLFGVNRRTVAPPTWPDGTSRSAAGPSIPPASMKQPTSTSAG